MVLHGQHRGAVCAYGSTPALGGAMKTCDLCGAERPKGSIMYCAECRTKRNRERLREAQARYEVKRTAREKAARQARVAIACATCRYGLAMASAELGYACAASVARTCSPLGPRRCYVERV